MTKRKPKANVRGNWKKISQSARRVRVSRMARIRSLKLAARTLGVGALAVLAVAACWGGYQLLQKGSKTLTSIVPSSPPEEVTFSTDGVLTKEWALERIDLAPEVPLMEIDIHAIKERLEAAGQVRRAVVTRALPDRLVLRVEEKTPMLRIAGVTRDNRRVRLLVAEDGALYQGHGYNQAYLSSLPYVAGVEIRQGRSGLRPLEGMAPVAELLRLARSETPELYATWSVVNCARLPLIEIASREIPEIIFRADQEFDEQLKKLQGVLHYGRNRHHDMHFRSVDLSLGEDADVPVAVY